ncbi:hypothetical protein K5X82_17155 [Halosquirtibacter xylanolyticus]|uniref:hypothetical protein n=1 Tax=Halosquirtibacter xylanolyticus TaxID=3374599 RepID=UPI003747BE84|nr:hypothetical protein K5X82_17155 [Prolixibacteraceae bacterium]
MAQIHEMVHKHHSHRKTRPREKTQWIDSQEVINRLHISQRKLQEMRLHGKISYTSFCGKIFFKECDVEKILNDHYHTRK